MVKGFHIALAFILLGVSPAFAVTSLNVNPVEGGNSLRFDLVHSGLASKKEVRIRVTATDGKRYQVFQRVADPIVNEKGERMDLQALETESLSNSNSSGTLYLQSIDHLTFGDQLIYTSASGGQSDSFAVGYAFDSGHFNGSGIFTGRLIFIVRSDGGESQSVINVRIESPSNFKISVVGGRAVHSVRISDKDINQASADFVTVSFSGNPPGGDVRVYQEIEPFHSESANEFDPRLLRLYTAGDIEGLRVRGELPMQEARELIYSSSKDEDSFRVYFAVDPEKIQEQEAGSYSGKVKYIIETNRGREEFLIDLECIIHPIFTMDIEANPEGISFSHVLTGMPPQEKEVKVVVRTNLHKPYQVLQSLQSPMTNENGKEFNKEYFTLKVDVPPGQKGKTKFPDFLPVSTGEYPIFASDSKGSPGTFKVIYRLQGYETMNAGNFQAPIRFSLDQN